MKLNGTRLEKRSPRKITKFQERNGGQKTTLQLNGLSIRKLQLEQSKPPKFFSTKTQEYSPISENNQAFYSTADFSFHLSKVSERKMHFKKKNPTFCCAGVN